MCFFYLFFSNPQREIHLMVGRCISLIEDSHWFLSSKALRLSHQMNWSHLRVEPTSVCACVCICFYISEKNRNLWESDWGLLGARFDFSGMDCGGACREELLWACILPSAWQRTSCGSPERHRAPVLPSAVAPTDLGLTRPSSARSITAPSPSQLSEIQRSLEKIKCAKQRPDMC